MNESKTGFFKSFFYSITSFGKYRLFLRQSTGRVVAYLILLSLVLALAICASWYSQVSELIDIFSGKILDDVPDFRLENGKLEIYAEMPIVIDGDLPVVIDTRTDTDPEEILYQYDNVILITSEKMIQKNYLQRQEVPWSIYGNATMTRDSLVAAIPILKPTLVIVFVIIAIFFSVFFIAGKFFSAFIVSLIGRAVNAARGTRLSSRNIFKISVYSMTLPLIVGTVLDIFRISIPFLWVLFYVGCSIYVYGALSSIKAALDTMYGNFGDFGNSGTFGGFDDFGGFGGPGNGSDDGGESGNGNYDENDRGKDHDGTGNHDAQGDSPGTDDSTEPDKQAGSDASAGTNEPLGSDHSPGPDDNTGPDDSSKSDDPAGSAE